MKQQAFVKNKPDATFATLSKEGDYTRLAVNPGVINKHYTPQQFATIAAVIGEEGAIKYSASYALLLSVPTARVEAATQALEAEGLLVMQSGPVVAMRACDFCDGEKMEAALATQLLYETIADEPVPRRVAVNVNGCASACYNPTYDDIGLVYQHNSFDIYLGAVPMGKDAQPGELFAKKVPIALVPSVVQAILANYKKYAKDSEPFHRFYKRTKHESFWR
ncbi:MAG TPA: precorrin-3B methylase [Metalysinibacillus sp.]